MKKLLCLLLALLMLTALVACGEKEDDSTPTSKPASGGDNSSTVSTPEPLSDNAYELLADALDKLVKADGVTIHMDNRLTVDIQDLTMNYQTVTDMQRAREGDRMNVIFTTVATLGDQELSTVHQYLKENTLYTDSSADGKSKQGLREEGADPIREYETQVIPEVDEEYFESATVSEAGTGGKRVQLTAPGDDLTTHIVLPDTILSALLEEDRQNGVTYTYGDAKITFTTDEEGVLATYGYEIDLTGSDGTVMHKTYEMTFSVGAVTLAWPDLSTF